MRWVAELTCPDETATVRLEVFAVRLRELMKERGWNVSRVIHACDGEVSAKQVERWMAGANAPNSENLSKLADAFDVTTDYLLGRTDWDGVDRRGRPVWTEAEREARKPEGPNGGDGPPLEDLPDAQTRAARRRPRRTG